MKSELFSIGDLIKYKYNHSQKHEIGIIIGLYVHSVVGLVYEVVGESHETLDFESLSSGYIKYVVLTTISECY